jgi:hypothetical protein
MNCKKCKLTGLFPKHIHHFCCHRQFGNWLQHSWKLSQTLDEPNYISRSTVFTVIRLSSQGSTLDNLPLGMLSVFINTLQNVWLWAFMYLGSTELLVQIPMALSMACMNISIIQLELLYHQHCYILILCSLV